MQSPPIAGGLGGVLPADHAVQALVDGLRGAIEAMAGHPFDRFDAVSYRLQVVAGLNYFVDIDGGPQHVHARIYRDLQGNVSLHSIKDAQPPDGELAYF